jgi:hypothetical protein
VLLKILKYRLPVIIVLFICIESIGQINVKTISCSDTVITSQKWYLDSIGRSLAFDSLYMVMNYVMKPMWIEFSKAQRFYASDGCHGIDGKYIAADGHLFFYDVGYQTIYCTYKKYENEIQKLQQLIITGLTISEYSHTDSLLLIETMNGDLVFKKTNRYIADKQKEPTEAEKKEFNKAIEKLWK